MAQTERTTTLVNGGIDTATIATLRGNIDVGKPIRASDLTFIKNMVNNANGHYHSYYDVAQSATYGNNGNRNTYADTRDSGGVDTTRTVTESVSSGASITTAMHNDLALSINELRNHTHSAYDATDLNK